MSRHLRLFAACAALLASAGCSNERRPPLPTDPTPLATVAVEFGGRVVNADAGGPVGNVRVSVEAVGDGGKPRPPGWVFPTDTATSRGPTGSPTSTSPSRLKSPHFT